MIEPGLITTIALAGLGTAATVGIWAVRLEGRQVAHEATDAVVHLGIARALDNVVSGSIRMEQQIDRLIEHTETLHQQASSERATEAAAARQVLHDAEAAAIRVIRRAEAIALDILLTQKPLPPSALPS